MAKNILLTAGLVFLTVFALALFFLNPPLRINHSGDGQILRVRIAHDISSARISSDVRCDVIKPSTGEVLLSKVHIRKDTKVMVFGAKVLVGKESFREEAIRLSPRNGGYFYFNGTEYRGKLDVVVSGDKFDAINLVAVEDYLKGVVPREVHSFWPMSALKAQAVASRSYAYFEASRRRSLPYDLTADTFSQVYGGKSAERTRATRAVVLTAGEVLKYGGKVIPGYFHTSCGGHTTSISRVWGGNDSEPFKGVRSHYCRWSPSFRWRARVSTEDILNKLRYSGYGFDRIDDIRTGKADPSGRVEYIKIRSRNKWFEVPIKDLMDSIGRTTLKSSNFRIRKYPLFYDFDGYGWGHGIGMCQWCSFGLSLRRWDYIRILEFFYPGSLVSHIG